MKLFIEKNGKQYTLNINFKSLFINSISLCMAGLGIYLGYIGTSNIFHNKVEQRVEQEIVRLQEQELELSSNIGIVPEIVEKEIEIPNVERVAAEKYQKEILLGENTKSNEEFINTLDPYLKFRSNYRIGEKLEHKKNTLLSIAHLNEFKNYRDFIEFPYYNFLEFDPLNSSQKEWIFELAKSRRTNLNYILKLPNNPSLEQVISFLEEISVQLRKSHTKNRIWLGNLYCNTNTRDILEELTKQNFSNYFYGVVLNGEENCSNILEDIYVNLNSDVGERYIYMSFNYETSLTPLVKLLEFKDIVSAYAINDFLIDTKKDDLELLNLYLKKKIL